MFSVPQPSQSVLGQHLSAQQSNIIYQGAPNMQVSQIYGGARKPNMQKSAALGLKQKYPTSGPGSLPLDIA